VKNNEVVYFMRNDENELIGINKNVCSRINMLMNEGKIETITFFDKVSGTIYPEEDFPENARKLRGFVWRIDEKIKSKEDIFPPEENEDEAKIQAATAKDNAKPNLPMPIRKETLNYDKKNTPKPKK
jgi:hypothetical protein